MKIYHLNRELKIFVQQHLLLAGQRNSKLISFRYFNKFFTKQYYRFRIHIINLSEF